MRYFSGWGQNPIVDSGIKRRTTCAKRRHLTSNEYTDAAPLFLSKLVAALLQYGRGVP